MSRFDLTGRTALVTGAGTGIGLALWLAGPGSAFVSGQTLLVDGGVFSQAVWPGY